MVRLHLPEGIFITISGAYWRILRSFWQSKSDMLYIKRPPKWYSVTMSTNTSVFVPIVRETEEELHGYRLIRTSVGRRRDWTSDCYTWSFIRTHYSGWKEAEALRRKNGGGCCKVCLLTLSRRWRKSLLICLQKFPVHFSALSTVWFQLVITCVMSDLWIKPKG